jgi:Helicase associated domain
MEVSVCNLASIQGEDWERGLASGGGGDWAAWLAQLRDYQRERGDAHTGYRAGDDPELGRWAAAQRAAFAEGQLPADRSALALLIQLTCFPYFIVRYAHVSQRVGQHWVQCPLQGQCAAEPGLRI